MTIFTLHHIADLVPPVITDCPSETIIRSANPATWSIPIAQDVIDPSPTVSCTPTPPTNLNLGMNTVTCTAVDSSGNSDTCRIMILFGIGLISNLF